MAGKLWKKFKRISNVVIISILAAFLFGWIFKNPEQRKYPDRELVRFWHMWTAGWKDDVEAICDSFNESQGRYEVIPLSLPKNVADSKLLLAVAGGSPPDCMAQWNQIVPQFADSQMLMPIDELMSDEELQTFRAEAYPIAQKLATFKGRLYCMPLALDVRSCYYRLDHLHEAGLLPDSVPSQIKSKADFDLVRNALPNTLEELERWGAKLDVFDDKGRLVRLGFLPQFLRIFAPVFGGGFYDWEKQELRINTPENRRALSHLAEMQNRLGYDRIQRFTSSLTGRHGADWPFAIGKRSITIDGQWRVQQLHKYAPDLPYVTSPIPPPEHGGKTKAGWVHGNYMIVPKGSPNPEGAWAFIKFWTGQDDPDKAAEFYTRSGWLPPTPKVAKTKLYQSYILEHSQFQTFIDVLDSPNIEPTPPVPFQLRLYDLVKRADESAMRGSVSPEKALVQLQKQVDEIQKRRKELGYEK